MKPTEQLLCDTSVLGLLHWYDHCPPTFFGTMKNKPFRHCHLPGPTHFITQKENFNKPSEGPAAIFRGKVSCKGHAWKLPREACCQRRHGEEPVSARLIVYLSSQPRLILTGCAFLLQPVLLNVIFLVEHLYF